MRWQSTREWASAKELNSAAWYKELNYRSVAPRHLSERELTFTYVRYMLSPVRLSVVCLSVTFLHATHAVVTFGDISTAFGTLAIR